MENRLLAIGIFLFSFWSLVSVNTAKALEKSNLSVDQYTASLTFPANYVVGDYHEFVKVAPIAAGASGYYYISISYTRNGVAAGATHVAAVSHANPSVWRETGRVNNNKYVDQHLNFTVDCNTEYGNAKFRVRALATHGANNDIVVEVKVHSINFNYSFTTISNIGNDTSVTKFLPMTNEWDLFVGNLYSTDGASIAIKALQNGNVGIGTASPQERLSVNGKIRAKEIKVEVSNWPDYVFEDGYKLTSLAELGDYIKQHKHLPGVPSASEVKENGIELGEMNKILLKKIEEFSLHLIEKNKKLEELTLSLDKRDAEMKELKLRIEKLEKK